MNTERSNGSLAKVAKPAFYYHISERRLGQRKRITLYPVGSDVAKGRGPTEPDNARICVSPTIAHCFTAISQNSYFQKMHIYRTYRKVIARYPYEVPDSRVTREKWLVHPTRFILVHVLNMKELRDKWPKPVSDAGNGDSWILRAQKEYRHEVEEILEEMGIYA